MCTYDYISRNVTVVNDLNWILSDIVKNIYLFQFYVEYRQIHSNFCPCYTIKSFEFTELYYIARHR